MTLKILMLFLVVVGVAGMDPLIFLKKFGYLSQEKNNLIDLSVAIRSMQRFSNLPQTGVLDKQTIQQMSKPRCGLPDHQPIGFQSPTKWTKNALTYKILTHTSDLSVADTTRIMAEAFEVWAKVTPLVFKQVKSSERSDLVIDFGNKAHPNCNYDFDGPGGVLAHAFFPPDGRAHFDEDEHFTDKTTSGTNLFWVAAHEFGHALGLDHSDVKGSLMFPYYGGYVDPFLLHHDDVRRIQELYGGKGGVTQPPPSVTKAATTQQRVCEDVFPDCYQTAQYCQTNGWKDYMLNYCYKTCYCGAQTTVATTKRTATATVTRQSTISSNCINDLGDTYCNGQKHNCINWKDFMTNYCYKTCYC